MIHRLITLLLEQLIVTLRRDVSDAVSEAVCKGVEDGFARVGIEVRNDADISSVRSVVVEAVGEERPKPLTQSGAPLADRNQVIEKRKRGRPRKHTNYDESHEAGS